MRRAPDQATSSATGVEDLPKESVRWLCQLPREPLRELDSHVELRYTMQVQAQTAGTVSDAACAQKWTAVDADKNGKISKTEAQKATELEFTRIDMDSNGTISVKEWKDCAAPNAIPGGLQADLASNEQEFARTDPIRAGTYRPKRRPRCGNRWAAVTMLTTESARSAGYLFAMMDNNADGKITWEEWKTRDQADTAARFDRHPLRAAKRADG